MHREANASMGTSRFGIWGVKFREPLGRVASRHRAASGGCVSSCCADSNTQSTPHFSTGHQLQIRLPSRYVHGPLLDAAADSPGSTWQRKAHGFGRCRVKGHYCRAVAAGPEANGPAMKIIYRYIYIYIYIYRVHTIYYTLYIVRLTRGIVSPTG